MAEQKKRERRSGRAVNMKIMMMMMIIIIRIIIIKKNYVMCIDPLLFLGIQYFGYCPAFILVLNITSLMLKNRMRKKL
jgi:hypothetical protein